MGNPGSIPGSRKIPWRRAWQPTPVFLPGESPWTEEPGGLQSMGLQRATKHSRKVLTYLAFLLVSDSIHSYISKERGKGQGNSTTRKIIGKTFPHSSVTSQIRLSHTAKTLNINPPAPHPNETFKSCPSESLISLKC